MVVVVVNDVSACLYPVHFLSPTAACPPGQTCCILWGEYGSGGHGCALDSLCLYQYQQGPELMANILMMFTAAIAAMPVADVTLPSVNVFSSL